MPSTVKFIFALLLLTPLHQRIVLGEENDQERRYVLIGVSGGLQDGFPDHTNLDYKSGHPDEESKAIFLGHALVRGYKSYLDVMQQDWRQYVHEPDQPLINCNVFPTGCYEHANQYWVYVVDSRQVMSVLSHEPRFLSITPDTGQIDLTNSEYTSSTVRQYMRREIRRQGKTDMDSVALPIVTAVWFHDSHVPSPPIAVLDDGTEVANFPGSLALWANVDDAGRTAVDMENAPNRGVDDCPASDEAKAAHRAYWEGVRSAIRAAEKDRPTEAELRSYHPSSFVCKKKARFGVGPDTARVNYEVTASDVADALGELGLEINFQKGDIRQSKDES